MKALSFIICFSVGIVSFSQERCATPPRSEESTERFENWIQDKIQRKKTLLATNAQRQAAEVYYIPVVFHIIHQGEPIGSGDNISTDRILEQMEALNQDFGKMNPRRNDIVPSDFEPVEANVEIQFVLARQDPDGLPTDGIVRVQGTQTKYDNDFVKSFSYWPSEDYMNIWVANTYPNIYGWAAFPVTNLGGLEGDGETNPERDGVVVDSEYIGINPFASGEFASFGQTVTHEVGHFLGLIHIWGDGNCSQDDFCADTPDQDGDNGGQSNCSYPAFDSCPDDFFADMFMNFMDYSDDQCMAMFTNDQKFRMRTVMEHSPRRLSLRTSPGLEYPAPPDYDMALLEITGIPLAVCETSLEAQLNFRNVGNETVTSFSFSYEQNGITQSETISGLMLASGTSTTVSFPLNFQTEGLQQMSWTITEVNGLEDENALNNARFSYTVVSTENMEAPFRENFETGPWISNAEGGLSEWQSTTVSGDESMMVDAYESTSEIESWLISPTFSLAEFSEAGLFFKMSYGINTNAPSAEDELTLLLSTACTEGFEEVWSSDLGDLAFDNSSTEWTAEAKENWLERFVDLSDFAGEEEVRVAFAFKNDGGNNFFLDDIELTNNSDKDQPRLQVGKFVAYPNPARESFKVTISLPDRETVRVQLFDISGSVVFEETFQDILNQTLTINTGHQYGTYFLRIRGRGIDQVQRILIGR